MVYEIIFSPTGGTKRVARILAQAMNGKICTIDLAVPPTELSKELEKASITANDLCILAMPSFKGRCPALAVERLKMVKGNGAKAVEVVVYGNREQEDTLIELQDAAIGAGFVPFAGITAIAEHSMVRTVAQGRPDAQDKKELEAYAEEILKKHKKQDAGAEADMLLIPGNRPYKVFPVEPCSIRTLDSCTFCGHCAANCPAGAIPVDDPRVTNGELCIGCMRCVDICPSQARGMTEEKTAFITGLLGKFAGGRKENHLYL